VSGNLGANCSYETLHLVLFSLRRAGHDTTELVAGRARQNRSAQWPTLRWYINTVSIIDQTGRFLGQRWGSCETPK